MAAFQNFLAGHQYGTGLRQQREQQQREQQFNVLAGQAYSASPDKRTELVGQAVSLNAERGMQIGETLGGVEDRRNRTLLNAAKLLTTAPEQYRPSVYQQIRGGLSQYIPNMPEQYDDTVAEAAQSIVSAYGGGQQGGAVQSRFIDDQGNVVALMRDGSTQIVGKADPSMQILEGEGGFYGVNRRNLQAAPVQLGGAPQPIPAQMPAPSQAVESSGRQVTIDPSLPPNVRAQIAANPDAFAALPEQAEVTLPPVERQGVPAQAAGQLRPATKPRDSFVQLTSDETAALGLPPGTVAQRNVSTGEVDIVSRPTAAAGGAKANKAASDARAKLPQLQNVVRGVDRIEQALAGLSGGVLGGVADTGPLDQFVSRYTTEGRELEAAVGGIQNSMLALTRVPGVGAQSDLEARIANLQYPSLDNPPEVNARTLENLRAFVADLQAAYDNVIQGAGASAAPAEQSSAPRRLRFNPATGRLE